MSITHSEHNLLSIPGLKPAPLMLVHACNCQGVWGRGIAEAFRKKFPNAYQDYRGHSQSLLPQDLLGTARIFEDSPGVYIASLYTSIEYRIPDGPRKILQSTALAVVDLLRQDGERGINAKFYSNKFNAGLFSVDWSLTEDVLRNALLQHEGVEWQVCTPPEFR